MKKLTALLALLLAFSLFLPALAQSSLEVVVTVPEARLRFFDNGMEEPLVEVEKDYQYGVYNAQGELILPIEYGFLDYLDHGLFEAINEEGLNNHALINLKNEVVVDYLYGAYEVISPDLVLGVMLEPATGEVYDYSSGFLGGGDKYLVSVYDVYRVSTKEKIGSFQREDYNNVRLVDEHLLIENKDGAVTVYDQQLQPVGTEEYLYGLGVEVEKNGEAFNLVGKYTKRVIAENVPYEYVSTSGVDEVFTIRGEEGVGLMDYTGKVLVPAVYSTIYANSAASGYVVVSQDNLKGIADLEGNLLVPCQYTDIVARFNRVVHNGYALVEKDGKLGYVNMKGEETQKITYSKSATVHGASLSLPDIDGSLYIISADGERTLTDYESFEQYFGNGMLLRGKKDGAYDIVDWHGKLLLDEEQYANTTINEAGTYLLSEDTLYKVVGE